MVRAFAVFLFIAWSAALGTAENFRCYECVATSIANHGLGTNCNDPFVAAGVTIYNNCAHSCQTVKVVVHGQTVTNRTCGSAGAPEGCVQLTGSSYLPGSQQCNCKSDLCNGQPIQTAVTTTDSPLPPRPTQRSPFSRMRFEAFLSQSSYSGKQSSER